MTARKFKVHTVHLSVRQNWSKVMGAGSRWTPLLGPMDSLPFGEENRKRARAGPSTRVVLLGGKQS